MKNAVGFVNISRKLKQEDFFVCGILFGLSRKILNRQETHQTSQTPRKKYFEIISYRHLPNESKEETLKDKESLKVFQLRTRIGN